MKLKLKIPESKKDILLKRFMIYENFSLNNDDITDDERLQKVLEIFYSIDKKYYRSLKYKDILELYNNIVKIVNEETELINTFIIDDIEYGLVPNFDDITYAEMLDLDTDDNILKLAILYRPIIEKKGELYLVEDYDGDKTLLVYEIFKEKITLDIYSGFIGFFLNIQNDLLNFTLKYMEELDLGTDKRKDLVKSGVGIARYMNYVEEILQSKMKYLK